MKRKQSLRWMKSRLRRLEWKIGKACEVTPRRVARIIQLEAAIAAIDRGGQ